MLKLNRILAATVAAIFIAGASSASITINPPTAVGSVVSAPWMAGDKATVMTFTNGASSFNKYHVTVLSDSWVAYDFDCELSPYETTYFVFESFTQDESKLTTECSAEAAGALSIVQTRIAPGARGLVVIQDDGDTDTLVSDFTILDFAQGYAFSANSWHVAKASTGSGDHNLAFDGTEYATLPGTLVTSFIAPDDDVTAELILYPLHGEPNWPSGVKMGGYLYDDDENHLSGFYDYNCFTVVALQDIFGTNADRRFGPAGAEYRVGHVVLQARATPTSYPEPGLVVPSLGWIVQTISANGKIMGGDFADPFGIANAAAWARQMLVTTDAIDTSDFNADAYVRP